MGSLSQTKYYLANSPAKITIVRRHHPLEGQQLDVRSAGRATVVVSLKDGSSLKIARHWTDADGVACTELAGNSPFTLHGLRELLRLFMSPRRSVRRRVLDDRTILDGIAEKGAYSLYTWHAGIEPGANGRCISRVRTARLAHVPGAHAVSGHRGALG